MANSFIVDDEDNYNFNEAKAGYKIKDSSKQTLKNIKQPCTQPNPTLFVLYLCNTVK
jgi:hypothetical protein